MTNPVVPKIKIGAICCVEPLHIEDPVEDPVGDPVRDPALDGKRLRFASGVFNKKWKCYVELHIRSDCSLKYSNALPH